MRIAILNRFAPPDRAPTAAAAAGLAEALAAALPQATVTLYASRAVYRGAGEASHTTIPVRRLPSFYDGAWPPARLAASLLEGWWLARTAARQADLVISLTDPPLLSLWVGPACRRRGRRWIEWTLDRYPALFAAAGLVRPDHPWLGRLAARDAALEPELVLGLGPAQLRHLAGQRHRMPPALVLPAGLPPPLPGTLLSPDPLSPRIDPPPPVPPFTLVYAGTLGLAHDPAALTALIARADPARFRFALAVTGHHAAALRRQLRGHPAVSWHEHLPWSALAAATAHLVTLADRFTHLSVPSKAVTAVALGRPFLFAGAAAADSWQQLGAAGWLLPTRPGGGYPEAALDAALAGLADPVQWQQRAAAARALATSLDASRRQALAALAAHIAGEITVNSTTTAK